MSEDPWSLIQAQRRLRFVCWYAAIVGAGLFLYIAALAVAGNP